ncbi:hypothetical protein AnigIFM59636_006667 [Aspergillus niger]|nr:hypothetical protein CBS11350_5380 [Aspergillus niger]KAI2914484.1 hypothetical protein CBS147320_10277 [Aspergillus niger]KAI2964009.1 hypothetical protein CBS147323_6503 [Aspergillus niger]KAI3022004.1 hypothetical protein CBS147347_7688 [Aspergillus niger]KAI3061117.1 hypothetical protein CBS147353_10051 [Aspergillus niger]
MPALPTTQSALVVQGPNSLRCVTDTPVPSLAGDQILVQTKAVALNPSDWKMLEAAAATPGAISGSDFAGVIIACGEEVQNMSIGERVCGFVFGASPTNPTNGAFADYIVAHPSLCFRVPPTMTFEEAASVGMGLMTVGLLFRSLGLQTHISTNPDAAKTKTNKPFVLVYGGSTATGTLAIQMLRHHGYQPITTCSPRHFPLVKQRGATAAFDYASRSCKEDIRAYTKGTLAFAMDCIADTHATTVCYGAIGGDGGRYCALDRFPPRLEGRRQDIQPEWIHSATIFGEDVQLAGSYHRTARPEDREFAIEWAHHCTHILARGELQTHPLQVQKGGLPRIIGDLPLLRSKQISGRKLVYPVGGA